MTAEWAAVISAAPSRERDSRSSAAQPGGKGVLPHGAAQKGKGPLPQTGGSPGTIFGYIPAAGRANGPGLSAEPVDRGVASGQRGDKTGKEGKK